MPFLDIIESCQLTDIYRLCNPNDKRFTWRRKNPIKQARLDYFLITRAMIDFIDNCTIISGYRSDHSIVQLNLRFTKCNIGKGVWKINNSLLSNKDYLNLINKIIIEEKLNYAVPVYSLDYIKSPESNESLQFVVVDDDFL